MSVCFRLWFIGRVSLLALLLDNSGRTSLLEQSPPRLYTRLSRTHCVDGESLCFAKNCRVHGCVCVHEFGFRKQTTTTTTMNSGNAEYLCWPNIRGGDVERINGVDDNDYSRNCLPFGNSQ